MLLAAGASHPAVAGLLGLGAAGLASLVVAMAWSVQARQIRLAEQVARRQFVVTAETDAAGRANGGGSENGNGRPKAAIDEAGVAVGPGPASPVIIEGPDRVVTGGAAPHPGPPAGRRPGGGWGGGGGP